MTVMFNAVQFFLIGKVIFIAVLLIDALIYLGNQEFNEEFAGNEREVSTIHFIVSMFLNCYSIIKIYLFRLK